MRSPTEQDANHYPSKLLTRAWALAFSKSRYGLFSTVDELPFFLQAEALKPFISEELLMSTNPIFYRTLGGGRGVGYNATLLRQVAEVYLKLRDHQLKTKAKISKRYDYIIRAADVLIRGLADVGIVALVDQATGYERDRAKTDLEEILKRFVGDELRPWIKTFPDEYYEQMFRLRGLVFPKDSIKRPQYFGHLTRDIVYYRLAPGLWKRLNEVIPRRPDGRLTVPAHRKLTENLDYRELLKLLGSVVTLMTLANSWTEFKAFLDRRHPRYGDTLYLPFDRVEPRTGL